MGFVTKPNHRSPRRRIGLRDLPTMPARAIVSARRSAFTLVELLVVLATIGLLISLLLPAVQSAREAARKTSCLNNLKQIGLALEDYHDTRGVFPPSGWTVAAPDNPAGKFVGWRALTLPYIEQAGLTDLYNFDLHWWEGQNLAAAVREVEIYQCPSVPLRRPVLSAVAKPPRPAMTFISPLAPTDYEVIMGVQPSIDPARYATPALSRSAMFRNSTVRMADILDGTSMTLVVVECAARPAVYRAGVLQPALSNDQGQGWIDSEGPFSLDGAGRDGLQQGLGPVLTPAAINATNENEPFSFHPAGAQCVFADAHARLIGRNISLRVFAALVTRAGGEVVAAGDY
jgi:hypothetical protein